MPAEKCHQCGSKSLETDFTLGQVVCSECGCVVERGILVSEVGFAEAAGGRVHVQGTFVSNYSTGIAGLRGRNSGQSSENVKKNGQEKIQQVGREMGLGVGITNGAQRSFSLAVDQRFNKGRRTDYLVASCLYLQCRLMQEPYMLIDFSERLQVNVFELAGTYLKLRTHLLLDKTMPEVDPAIYNIHFARRLSLGPQAHRVALDASRLVRRFKADWMTQGRKPAGVCGACLIVASRMSNFLRTPEEVGQVVKCSPYTIRKRLREFARTQMAQKSVKEWRLLTDKDLDEIGGEVPPIVRENAFRAAKELRVKRIQQGLPPDGDDDELNELDLDDDDDEEDGSEAERKRKGKRKAGREEGDDVDPVNAETLGRALQQLQEMVEGDEDKEDEEDQEEDLENLPQEKVADDLDETADDPEEAKRERKRQRMAYQRENRAIAKGDGVVENEESLFLDGADEDVDELLNEKDDQELENTSEKHDEDDDDENNNVEKEEYGETPPTQLKSISQIPLPDLIIKPDPFDQWHDPTETVNHFSSLYFSQDPRLIMLKPEHLQERISKWLTPDRDPKEVAYECQVVDMAYKRREYVARTTREEVFEDLDEEELDSYWVLDDRDKQLRARVWLSQNGKWLEQAKVKEEQRQAYAKAHGIDPNKPKPKRKRNNPNARPQQPYKSARDAIQGIANQKKFSSRIDYAALSRLGLGGDGDEEGLQVMNDEKDDEDYDAVGEAFAGLEADNDNESEVDPDSLWGDEK